MLFFFMISFYFLSHIKGPSFIAQLNYLVTAMASCLLIIIAMNGSERGLRKFLKCKIFSRLGILSYGVYLTHILIMRPFLDFPFQNYAINFHFFVFFILLLSFVAAFLIYKFIEVPLAIYRKWDNLTLRVGLRPELIQSLNRI